MDLLAIPNNLSLAGHIDEVASLKIDKQVAGLRIEEDVAHRVEVIVAGEVGKHEGPVVLDFDEPRLTASMGNIRALGYGIGIVRIGGGDKQRIGLLDKRACALVKSIRAAHRSLFLDVVDLRQDLHCARLDILRAIAECLTNCDNETVGPDGLDPSGEPVPAPVFRLNTEYADIRSRSQCHVERIPEQRPGSDVEIARIGRRYEPRPARNQRGPRPPLIVNSSKQQEWQHFVKGAMLVRHVIANNLPCNGFDLFADTKAFLYLLLTRVKGRRCVTHAAIHCSHSRH